MQKKTKVCMIVQNKMVKGGIAAVVSGYYGSKLEQDYDMIYVESYKDGGKLTKLFKGICGYFHFAKVLLVDSPDIVHIAIDFHGRVHKPMAKILAKKLEEFDPMFIEEPVLCENMEVFKEIAVACNIPIATGERLFTKYDFKRLLQVGGVDIIQPDLSHAGGLTEVKKIASMAEAYDVALAPHCPLGPIALAACLNVDATCYNAVIQEQSIGIHYNVGKSVLDYALNKQDFQFVDGFCAMPTKPGLGVEVNKEIVLEENLTKHQWKNPIWRHVDGSVAEW